MQNFKNLKNLEISYNKSNHTDKKTHINLWTEFFKNGTF